MGYQRFLNQLGTAVGQQRQSLAWHQNNLNKARETWQQAYARVEGLRKLVQRYIDEARRWKTSASRSCWMSCPSACRARTAY